MNAFRCLASGLALVLLAGCGGSEADLAPVSGRITLDGEPLKGASVSFQPVAKGEGDDAGGGGSAAITDENGEFTLRTVFSDEEGAVVGDHVVSVSLQTENDPGSDAEGQDNDLPETYNGANSQLKFTVPADGSTEANFALSRDGSVPQ